jgi:hypothetical protein
MLPTNYNQNPEQVPATSIEFQSNVKKFRAEWYQFYNSIGGMKTPTRDKKGTKIINQRDGLDYIIEGYMRGMLDKHFVGWSWESAGSQPLQIVLNFVVVTGHLVIIDEHLLAFGIIPPYRRYLGVGGARIQFKSGKPMTPENVVDIDKNVKAANSNALKVAINRLCHIGDDVYKKRLDEDGFGGNNTGGIKEEQQSAVFEKDDTNQLGYFIADNKIKIPEAMKVLEIKSFVEVKDVNLAIAKLKVARGMAVTKEEQEMVIKANTNGVVNK